MRELFRYQWRGSHYHGAPISDLWFALGTDDGVWWFDAFFIGRAPLTGGAAQATAFARWLLEDPPPERYEKEFLLVEDEPMPGFGITWIPDGEHRPVHIQNTRLTVECLLGREEVGGPEYLLVVPAGHAPDQGFGFQVCAELECEPLDRCQLESTAAELFAIGESTSRNPGDGADEGR
jgi:hypothetical protein